MSGAMTRQLGRSGIEVSAMGLGSWAIGGPFWRDGVPVGWGEVDDDESIRAIHAALDLGVTFIDTADVYGTGHSERVIGRALRGRRDRVAVAKDAPSDEVLAQAKALPGVAKYLEGKTLVKEVVVPGRLVNLVIK